MPKILERPYESIGEVVEEHRCGHCLTLFTYKKSETYDRVNPNDRPVDWRIFIDCPTCHSRLAVSRYVRMG